jgi:hypothetical protein
MLYNYVIGMRDVDIHRHKGPCGLRQGEPDRLPLGFYSNTAQLQTFRMQGERRKFRRTFKVIL